ncbi:MAG: hypothetical protein P1P64_00970 [Treponemataceae bacterium]
MSFLFTKNSRMLCTNPTSLSVEVSVLWCLVFFDNLRPNKERSSGLLRREFF